MNRGPTIQDELRPEYDLRNLRVQKFGPARNQFGNFVKLAPDVAEAFADAVSANKALRFLIQGYQRKGFSTTSHGQWHLISDTYRNCSLKTKVT